MCRICFGRVTKKARANHLKCLKHKVAERLQNKNSAAQDVEMDEIEGAAIPPAKMLLADRYLHSHPSDSEDDYCDDQMQIDDVGEPFNGVTEHGLHLYDLHGKEIIFSAGDLETRRRAETEWLWKDIEELNYYDHTLLAKTTYSARDMFGDSSEDATVSGVVAAMSSLGMSFILLSVV